MTTYLGYRTKVHGYNETLFAAKPANATAAITFEDTSNEGATDETVVIDYHNVRGHLDAGNLITDPFRTPYYFATEEDARAAVKAIEGLELYQAVKRVEALRATSLRRAK